MEFKSRWRNRSSARGGNFILSAEIVIFPQLSFSFYVGVAMTNGRLIQYLGIFSMRIMEGQKREEY